MKVVMAWKEQLGEDIAKARRRAGMSQIDLEQALEVSRQTISLYERGKTSPPFETLAQIARVLSVDQFVVEDLHITFSRNGARPGLEALPQQLKLDFDDDRGVTVRIEATGQGVVIKKMLA
jgi:transcriptional regulator with XRE-family HTH domain